MNLKAFVQAAMAILAFLSMTSAAPALSPTADKAPENAHTHDADYMALFFKNWDYFAGADEGTAIQSGQAWPGRGLWNTCYQIAPDWTRQKIGSIKLSPAAQSCWFYLSEDNTNCGGTVSGVDFWPIDAGPNTVGQEPNFGKPVGSWICISKPTTT